MAKRAATKKTAAKLDATVRVLALHGPEQRLKRDRLAELRDALRAEHGEVEECDFDGKSAELAEVFDELRGFSLMATYKLVVIDDAEPFVKSHRAALERYCESPVDHATLVMRSDGWHRGNLDKAIAKVGAVMKCDAPSPREASAWIAKRAKQQHGATMDADAATLLVERIGPDMGRLDGEAGKLALMADSGRITAELVREATAAGSDEKAWALQEAMLRSISRHDAEPALAMVDELVRRSGQPEVLVLYAAADLCRKLAVAQAMMAQHRPENEIAKAARVWGPQVRPFLEVVRGLGAGRAARLLKRALSADSRSKSGLGPATRNLETLCVLTADNR